MHHDAGAMEAAVGVAALLVGAAGGYAAGRGWIPLGAARETAPGTPGAAAADDWAAAERGRPWASDESDPADQAARERDQLIGACADLAGRIRGRQPAMYTILARDLAAIGVALEVPDGEPFDAGRHNAVGTEPAPGKEHDLLIAQTTRLGYRHHEVQARVPDVIVYRWKES